MRSAYGMRFMNFRVAGAALLACVGGLAALAQNGGHGFDASRMDTSVAACTDFYQFGNAGQGGLSLPNKDYYTKTDDKSKQLRDAFVRHVSAMFQLLGDAPAQADREAQTVLTIETRLAENSRSPVELREVEKQYHIMS